MERKKKGKIPQKFSKNRSRFREKRGEHDQRHGMGWMIAIILEDGPVTLSEIEKEFRTAIRRFGFFNDFVLGKKKGKKSSFREEILDSLTEMINNDQVLKVGERYQLTGIGIERAKKGRSEIGHLVTRITHLSKPETASKITLIIHLVLAAVKLPAGFLSGSVGLINDAMDTLLDGLSSLMVFFGIRFKKENVVNVFLIILMLFTGGFTLFKAVNRFFVPFNPVVDWFAFAAAITSAVVCFVLWLYQRYVGLRNASMVLITQSVDSRNHVIVAVGVFAGLVASLLKFSFLDTFVGLFVSILIFKSVIELTIDVLRARGDEEVDLSRYRFGIYEKFRKNQLKNWMLYEVRRKDGFTKESLLERTEEAIDFHKSIILKSLGLAQKLEISNTVKEGVQELLDENLLRDDGNLHITKKGRNQLKRQMRKLI
jgi:Co/Zn/Cd efflux system component